MIVFGWFVLRPRGGPSDVLTATVIRGDLPVTVTGRGELDSIKSTMVRCDVEAKEIKLVSIVPEGTHVKKGETVAQLDTEELKCRAAEQEVKWKTAEAKSLSAVGDLEVQKNKEQSEYDKAELAWELAKIDLEKYENRRLPGRSTSLRGTRAQKKDLKEAEDKLDFTRALVKKGFAPLEQIRIQELEVETKRFQVSQGEAELALLTEFDRQRQITELKGKAREAEGELDRTKKSQKAATAKCQSEADARRSPRGWKSRRSTA